MWVFFLVVHILWTKMVSDHSRYISISITAGKYVWRLQSSRFFVQSIPNVLVPCKIMRCFASPILDGFVTTSGEKRSDDLHMAMPCCPMEWGPSILVLRVYLSACLNQTLDNLHMAIPGCHMEWGETFVILLADLSACFNQHIDNLQMAIP